MRRDDCFRPVNRFSLNSNLLQITTQLTFEGLLPYTHRHENGYRLIRHDTSIL